MPKHCFHSDSECHQLGSLKPSQALYTDPETISTPSTKVSLTPVPTPGSSLYLLSLFPMLLLSHLACVAGILQSLYCVLKRVIVLKNDACKVSNLMVLCWALATASVPYGLPQLPTNSKLFQSEP